MLNVKISVPIKYENHNFYCSLWKFEKDLIENITKYVGQLRVYLKLADTSGVARDKRFG